MFFYLQVLALTITGVILLWIGYTLFFGRFAPFFPRFLFAKIEPGSSTGNPGEPQVCPICSLKLRKGELVQSTAFPSITGGIDRLMYIKGCCYCLIDTSIKRKCPVCKAILTLDDFLVTRMFERTTTRNHVHVSGCNQCKKTIPLK
jgi:hypothetical protein